MKFIQLSTDNLPRNQTQITALVWYVLCHVTLLYILINDNGAGSRQSSCQKHSSLIRQRLSCITEIRRIRGGQLNHYMESRFDNIFLFCPANPRRGLLGAASSSLTSPVVVCLSVGLLHGSMAFGSTRFIFETNTTHDVIMYPASLPG